MFCFRVLLIGQSVAESKRKSVTRFVICMTILPLPPLSPSHSLFHSRFCRLSEVLLTIALILQRSASSSSSLISTTSNSISTASSSAAPVSHRSAFAAPSRTPVRPAAPTVFTVAVACLETQISMLGHASDLIDGSRLHSSWNDGVRSRPQVHTAARISSDKH
jgi:hypothetical protein